MLETSHEDVDTTVSSHNSIAEYHPTTPSPQDVPEDLSDLEQYFDQERSRDISEDLKKLHQLIDTTAFKNHPILPGVQTLSLSIENLPQELTDFIENELQCDITSFAVVNTTFRYRTTVLCMSCRPCCRIYLLFVMYSLESGDL